MQTSPDTHVAISVADHSQIAPYDSPSDGRTGHGLDDESAKKHETNVEVNEQGQAEDNSEKNSKLSVWLMIVYSGLAIGSDG